MKVLLPIAEYFDDMNVPPCHATNHKIIAFTSAAVCRKLRYNASNEVDLHKMIDTGQC